MDAVQVHLTALHACIPALHRGRTQHAPCSHWRKVQASMMHLSTGTRIAAVTLPGPVCRLCCWFRKLTAQALHRSHRERVVGMTLSPHTPQDAASCGTNEVRMGDSCDTKREELFRPALHPKAPSSLYRVRDSAANYYARQGLGNQARSCIFHFSATILTDGTTAVL